MNQVMGKEALNMKAQLNAFEAQFRTENPERAQQIDRLLAGSEADKTKSQNQEPSRQPEDGEKNKVKQRQRSLDREIDF
jgi:hypothetical protein